MGVSAHLALWNIVQIGLSHYLFRNRFSNGWDAGMMVGRRLAFLLFPLPPSFPEHFCEFVGFDAQQLIQ